jgi:hypothetical protein
VKASWVEANRFDAVSGSNARDARDWFAREHLDTHKSPVWLDEGLGTFEVLGRTFRIWIGGIDSNQWVIEELKAKGK